jgi:hypothetical protein
MDEVLRAAGASDAKRAVERLIQEVDNLLWSHLRPSIACWFDRIMRPI